MLELRGRLHGIPLDEEVPYEQTLHVWSWFLTELKQQHQMAKLAPCAQLGLRQPAWIAAFSNMQHTSKAAAFRLIAVSCATWHARSGNAKDAWQRTSHECRAVIRRPFSRASATSGAQRVERRRSKSRSVRSMSAAGTCAQGTAAVCAASLSAAASSTPSCTCS